MNCYRIVAALVWLSASVVACANGSDRPDASSVVYTNGKPVELTDSYAYIGFDPTGKNSGPCPVVALTDGTIDRAALNAAVDPWDELRHQQNNKFRTLVVMRLLNDGSVLVDLIQEDEGVFHGLGDSSEKLQITRKSDKRVEGSFVSKDEREKRLEGHVFWDLHFAADIARTLRTPPKAAVITDEQAPPPPPPPPPHRFHRANQARCQEAVVRD